MTSTVSFQASKNFYPRSPRGERQTLQSFLKGNYEFLSTLPARGATWGPRSSMELQMDFYPRSPRGERLQRAAMMGHS